MKFCRLCVSSSNDLIDLFGPVPKNIGDLDENYKINLVQYINAMRAVNNVNKNKESADDGIICVPCGKRINDLMNRTSKAYAFGNTVLKIVKPEVEPAMITKLYQEIHKITVWTTKNFEEATDEEGDIIIQDSAVNNNLESSNNQIIKIFEDDEVNADHSEGIKSEDEEACALEDVVIKNENLFCISKSNLVNTSYLKNYCRVEKCINFKRETNSILKIEENDEEVDSLMFTKFSLDAFDIPEDCDCDCCDLNEDDELSISTNDYNKSSENHQFKNIDEEILYANLKKNIAAYNVKMNPLCNGTDCRKNKVQKSSTEIKEKRSKRKLITIGREYETRSKKKKMDEIKKASIQENKKFKFINPQIRVKKIETLLEDKFLKSKDLISFPKNVTDHPIEVKHSYNRNDCDVDAGSKVAVKWTLEDQSSKIKLSSYPVEEKLQELPLKVEYLMEILESYKDKVYNNARNL